jgi:hypothetical protein
MALHAQTGRARVLDANGVQDVRDDGDRAAHSPVSTREASNLHQQGLEIDTQIVCQTLFYPFSLSLLLSLAIYRYLYINNNDISLTCQVFWRAIFSTTKICSYPQSTPSLHGTYSDDRLVKPLLNKDM